MKKKIFAVLCIVIFCSHDMYLKLDTYFLQPNTKSTINLFNGTFDKSENVIDRDRMLDASFVGNGSRTKIKVNQWEEKDSVTILNFNSKEEGTWVAGVSTKPRSLEMKAEAFNKYLKHDGVKDMLLQREINNTLKEDAIEKYSKHVKVIFQVGAKKTDDWSTVLGYPIEFIPLQNPYDLNTGDNLKIKLLRGGKPLANQLVYSNYKASKNGHSHDASSKIHTHEDENHKHSHENEHSHDPENHTHTKGQELKTDKNGIVSVNLTNDGIWYLRTIHLVKSDEKDLTHESNWATLTFEVTHTHNSQSHSHEHEEGVPFYIFIIGSLLLIGILFFVFNRKK